MASTDLLSNTNIDLHLTRNARNIFKNIVIHDTVDSTMLEAKRFLKAHEICHGSVILSEYQTAGKGRLGRSFYSPKNTGIYMSIIYSAKEYSNMQKDCAGITVATAVAVHNALDSFAIDSKIKWVNDIFIDQKKVCGILTEGVFSSSNSNATFDTFIIGIGINVSKTDSELPDDIKDIATFLPKDVNRNHLVSEILNQIATIFTEQSNLEIIDSYREHSLVLGKKVQVIRPDVTFPAKVLAITDEAHLLIELDDGTTQELLSGEVSIRF